MDDRFPATGAGERPNPLHAFAELALIAVDAGSPEQTLRHIAELAKHTLGGVEEVSLTVIENGRPGSVVFTGPLAVDLDERQYELGFGRLTAAEHEAPRSRPERRRLHPEVATRRHG